MQVENWLTGTNVPLEILPLVVNLIIGFILSLVLRYHFRVFGSTLSNREEFAQVFPFVLLTTLLIISIVKSSLALSLGLVGALSIVRFRTPIKEPEELAYLFVAIAIGLGLGANQTLPTIVGSLAILSFMAIVNKFKKKETAKNIYLSIDWIEKENESSEQLIGEINKVILKHVITSDLRRFDVRQNLLEATYFVDIESSDKLFVLTNELRQIYPGIGITFLDQNQLPSV